MIHVTKGMVRQEGDLAELVSDAIIACVSVIELLDSVGESSDGKRLGSHLAKTMMMTIQECVKQHGFDAEITPADREHFDERYSDVDFSSDHRIADGHHSKGDPFTMGMSGDALTEFLMGL